MGTTTEKLWAPLVESQQAPGERIDLLEGGGVGPLSLVQRDAQGNVETFQLRRLCLDPSRSSGERRYFYVRDRLTAAQIAEGVRQYWGDASVVVD